MIDYLEVETGMISDTIEWISFEYLKLTKTLPLFEYPHRAPDAKCVE
jgi:hypothetical protein